MEATYIIDLFLGDVKIHEYRASTKQGHEENLKIAKDQIEKAPYVMKQLLITRS